MKITEVKHAQKSGLSCRKCGVKILPSRDEKQKVEDKRTGKIKTKVVRVLGDPYRWIKFNRGPTIVRCMKTECRFRPSDMTSSDKMSQLYAAQESAEDSIQDLDLTAEGGEIEPLRTILEDLSNEIEEVKDGYNESADNMEERFTGGSPTIDDCREKADSLESWKDEVDTAASELKEWDGDDPNEGTCKTCNQKIVRNDSGSPWEHEPPAHAFG